MEKFDLKKHNKKIFELTKSAARGTYPSKKVAKMGSIIGTVIGLVLVLMGMMGLFLGSSWSIGSLLAGAIIVISNVWTFKRIS